MSPGEVDVTEPQPSVATNDAELDGAWRELSSSLLKFATALVGPHDAHDITANVFVRASRRPDFPHSIDHLDRYLLRAIRNEAHNLYRQRRRQWEPDLVAVGAEATHDFPADLDLLRAVSSLSVQQRSIVFLAYWHDMTESEIADALDLARSTVHRTLTRARSHLRKALQ